MANSASLDRLKVYHYWRSSSSWRVRWAFALKGIECEWVPVSLLDGEAEGPEHSARNPLGFVPVLQWPERTGHRRYLSESMAIISWAESVRPEPRLFPEDPELRARAVQLAEIVNASIQPLQNPTTLEHHSDDPERRKSWAQHWIHRGFSAYEHWLQTSAGRFSVGDELTIADLCLVPQCYNAARFEVSTAGYPTLHRVYEAALATPSAQASAPDRYRPDGA